MNTRGRFCNLSLAEEDGLESSMATSVQVVLARQVSLSVSIKFCEQGGPEQRLWLMKPPNA